MNFLLSIPLPLRLVVLALVAAMVATLLNAAVYEFAYRHRSLSPWQAPPPGYPPRNWWDRLPVVGWWRLRRETHPDSPRHWVRPMLIELIFPLALAWLYWWETAELGLVLQQGAAEGLRHRDLLQLAGAAHLTFLSHAILISLLLVASMIDFDEFTIPDIVTLPGTIVALILAATLPLSLLPQISELAAPVSPSVELVSPAGGRFVGHLGLDLYYYPVHADSLGGWPAKLAPREPNSLLVAIGCYWFWCFAFVRRRWLRRRGWSRALRHFLLRIGNDWGTSPLREITLVGTLLIAAVWWWGEGAWLGLLTALIGLAAGGGAIWLIRVLASGALGKEAMGFGDVLLMMMIGAFVGWQATILIFFLAPFFGLVLAIARLLLHQAREVPYGPFLSMGTVATIVGWDSLWGRTGILFDVPWLVPVIMVACIVACGLILAMMQLVKRLMLGPAI